jgi:hypothetical protein
VKGDENSKYGIIKLKVRIDWYGYATKIRKAEEGSSSASLNKGKVNSS